MPPEIKRLAEKGMYDPVTIKVKAATLTIDTVEQFFVEVADREKPDALAEVLKAERPDQAIIFARTKIGVDRLTRRLGDNGVRVKALHGDMSQGPRDGVMIAFKGGRERLLVATDIAARGLDISGVTHIINYDMPNSPDVYVHRIGRTGRVGRSGRAITLITPKQQRTSRRSERTRTREIEPWSADGAAPRGDHAASPERERARARDRAGRATPSRASARCRARSCSSAAGRAAGPRARGRDRRDRRRLAPRERGHPQREAARALHLR